MRAITAPPPGFALGDHLFRVGLGVGSQLLIHAGQMEAHQAVPANQRPDVPAVDEFSGALDGDAQMLCQSGIVRTQGPALALGVGD